jgi:hypothetical protein
MTAEQPVLLVELERDLGAPPLGWARELDGRGVVLVEDDLGRAAIDRAVARALYAEYREAEARAARHRQEIERRAIEADEARRAAIPKGVPVAVAGVTAAELLMALDSDERPHRRETVLEHSLRNPAGSITYHSIEGTTSAGGAS